MHAQGAIGLGNRFALTASRQLCSPAYSTLRRERVHSEQACMPLRANAVRNGARGTFSAGKTLLAELCTCYMVVM